ncbi:MAG: glycosyltransferase family 4 protein [Gammaproteobacteria bacterium]|nr:glycosyltransferase family 4 protein [Gammaproteobacteria bacterium]
MRIVHLESGARLYGGARQVAYLIEGLEQLGIDNVLLCAGGSAIAQCALPAEVIEMPLGGDLDVGQCLRLTHMLRGLGADLLHVHSRRGADIYGGLAARRAGVPAVLTRRVASAEPVLWARLKFRHYARIIAISSAIRGELTEHFGLAPSKLALVPSAVDADCYRDGDSRERLAQAFDLTPDAFVVGCVAQLIPRKGHATLLQSIARLATAHPDLRLICFGTGPLEAALVRHIAALGLTQRVMLAGFREDLAALLPGLDLLVHAANREGLGVAVLEALAARVPVVAAAAGGVPDIIEDGVTGLLVPPDDEAALAAAIERMLSDPALRGRVVEAGTAKVERVFSIPGMARGNLDVYREVLGSRGTD